MDRHPQQIKRERQDKKRRARNVDGLSRLRTHVKKVLSAITANCSCQLPQGSGLEPFPVALKAMAV
jgi:ribosomal protein S20